MNAERPTMRCAAGIALALLLLTACDGMNRPQPELSTKSHGVQRSSAVQMGEQLISEAELQELGITESVRYSLRFSDQQGDHAVVFSRHSTHEVDPVDGVVTDRILLSVALHSLPSTQTGQPAEWRHSADVECDGVDIVADFYPGTFSVTDLDGNGTGELTFAYHRFCGGGIDPRDVTVVVHEGGNSYVLEGQTQVKVGDDPPFGGGFEMDEALSAAPRWLQDKALQTFQQVRDGTLAEAAR